MSVFPSTVFPAEPHRRQKMNVVEEIEQLEPSAQIQRCDSWLGNNRDDSTDTAEKIRLLRETAMLKQLLKQRDETIQQRDETIQQQKETIEQKDETIEQQSLKRVKKHFRLFPDTSMSTPHYPHKHGHAGVFQVSLDEVRKRVIDAVPEGFWNTCYAGDDHKADSEASVLVAVSNLLTAVLRGMELHEVVEINHNRSLAGMECDILLSYEKNRLPFAVIELKKPGNSWEALDLIWGKEEDEVKEDEDDDNDVEEGGSLQNRVAGQVFGQMMALKLFGFPTVTGMISTMNQWRIVGLRDGGDGIIDDVVENVRTFRSQTAEPETTQPVSSPGEKVPTYKKNQSKAERKIWGSEIVPSHRGLEPKSWEALRKKVEKSGEKIVSLLVLFVYKAFSNLIDRMTAKQGVLIGPSLYAGQSPCRILVNDKYRRKDDELSRKPSVFTFGTVTLARLELGTFNEKLAKIHVCSHLGIGDHANVCLGTSTDGRSCCAVKFYHAKEERKALAEEECSNWKAVYGWQKCFAMPYSLQVAGGHCLVMPYLHPIPPKKRLQLLDSGKIRNALKAFTKSGFIHVDLKWRHIRMWRGEESHIFIIDLEKSSLESFTDKAHVGKWIKGSIKHLRNTKDTNAGGSSELSESWVSEDTITMEQQLIPRRAIGTKVRKVSEMYAPPFSGVFFSRALTCLFFVAPSRERQAAG